LTDNNENVNNDSIFIQQKWVKHWIDKELNRTARKEVQYRSNHTTGEKEFISKYQWYDSPPPVSDTLSKNKEQSLGIYPTVIFIDKKDGKPFNKNDGIITIRNKSSEIRKVSIEASPSIKMIPLGSLLQNEHDFYLPSYSCIR
jgi:hypothetical protein